MRPVAVLERGKQTHIPIKAQVGYLYFPSSLVLKVKPADERRFSLKEMQKAVEGDVQLLIDNPTMKFRNLYCNEDGLRLALPPNPHTQKVVDMGSYILKGYPEDWKVLGNIFGIKYEDVNPSLPTINKVMKTR